MAARYPHGVGYTRHVIDGAGFGLTTLKGVDRPKLKRGQRVALWAVAKLGHRRRLLKARFDKLKSEIETLDDDIVARLRKISPDGGIRGVRIARGPYQTDTLSIERVGVEVADEAAFGRYLGVHKAEVITGIKVAPFLLKSAHDAALLERWFRRHGYDPDLINAKPEFSKKVLDRLIAAGKLAEPPEGVLVYGEPVYTVKTEATQTGDKGVTL